MTFRRVFSEGQLTKRFESGKGDGEFDTLYVFVDNKLVGQENDPRGTKSDDSRDPLFTTISRMTTKHHKILIKGAILALLVTLIFLLSRYGPQPFSILGPEWEDFDDLQQFYSRRERISGFLTSFGPYSSAVFILLQALQVVVSPIPGELTGVVGGYVYGETFGFLLSTVGLTLGSWVAFELASILGRPFVEKFVKREILEKFNFLTTNAGATICFLLFIIPGFPKDILSYILGLSPMRLSTFLIVSTIGRMPGTYVLTVEGASIGSEEYYMAAVFMVISAAILFFAYLCRTHLFHWIKKAHGEKVSL